MPKPRFVQPFDQGLFRSSPTGQRCWRFGYFQLRTLSLLTPALAATLGSIIPSGPADQTIKWPLYPKLLLGALGGSIESNRLFKPVAPPLAEDTFVSL